MFAGSIATDLARVARASILENAMLLLEAHHSSKHLMEVRPEAHRGTSLKPTGMLRILRSLDPEISN